MGPSASRSGVIELNIMMSTSFAFGGSVPADFHRNRLVQVKLPTAVRRQLNLQGLLDARLTRSPIRIQLQVLGPHLAGLENIGRCFINLYRRAWRLAIIYTQNWVPNCIFDGDMGI
jgi:hypothetical protein